jgi:hypothetical protein
MAESTSPTGTPLADFSQCHRTLLVGIRAFAALPELVVAAERARATAAATLALFEDAILPHHADEEAELFPAVRASSKPGDERVMVEGLIGRLTAEHRSIEALWATLKPGVKQAAAGAHGVLDAEAVAALAFAYNRHATYEETEFLPLAAEILGRNRNHMAALDLSMHLRHTPLPVGYI